jgi:drug/metabolite transporter (DMT)-like permease
LTLARVGIAASALVPYAVLTAQPFPRNWRIWAAFALLGLVNNALPFSLIFWGQLTITASLAAIFNATTPFFTVILAHFVTSDEKLNGGKIAGVVLGLTGVMLIIGPSALAGITSGILGSLAVLLAAACYAAGGLFARRFREMPATVTAAGQLTMSAVIMFPVAALLEPHGLSGPVAGTALAAVLALSLLSTALAYVIYFRILRTAGATNVLLVTFLIPVSAAILGYIMLGEKLALEHFLGMAVIGLGLSAVDGRPLPWLNNFVRNCGKTL